MYRKQYHNHYTRSTYIKCIKTAMKRAQAIANIYKDEKEQMKEIIQRVDCSDVFSIL